MGKNSKIAWTDHTFNHVRGCSRVSPGCTNCYAAELSKRNPATLGIWGDKGSRVVAAEAMWKQPIKWNNEAAEAHSLRVFDRPRVFNASLSDWAEDWKGPMVNSAGAQLFKDHSNGHFWNQTENIVRGMGDGAVTMNDVRQRLFGVIDKTPLLDWLMLTKRPENIERMISTGPRFEESSSLAWYRENLWLGTTVENQAMANRRIGHLLRGPRFGPVRFLSMEPLLGPVDLRQVWEPYGDPVDLDHGHLVRNYTTGFKANKVGGWTDPNAKVDWVIVGCESGSHRRETKLEWVRSLRDQCQAAGVAFFMKQLEVNGKVTDDINQFPDDLQIREYPDQKDHQVEY